ncbi:MAG: Sip1-related alpha-galactosidase [Christensenellales bacterium]
MRISTYHVRTTEGGKHSFMYEIGYGRNTGITVLRIAARAEAGSFDGEAAVEMGLEMPETIDGCMAVTLYSPFWCRPYFGRDFTAVPPDTQGLLWKNNDGSYGFMLPVCDGETIASLGSIDGRLTLMVGSGCAGMKEIRGAALVSGTGMDPYRLIRACGAEAGAITGTKPRGGRRYPEIFEYLGWCTWDAMEIWVNEAETLEKCREFREKNVPVRWVILDDMWAEVEWTRELPRFTPHSVSFAVMHASKLKAFRADPARFPRGLGHCIAEVNKLGMEAGVWHPVTGYWAGLSPDGEAARELEGYTCVTKEGRILPDLSDREKAYGYFAKLHAYLKECGAAFVKVDNQSCLRRNYRDLLPAAKAAENMHAGLERSVGEFFGGDMINCMGMANENMFNRPDSAIARCSDDFQPENRAWFAKHILQCAFNSLIQGQFFVSDWDMWWTDDGQAVKNSLLRAVSGGPVYISDRLGRTRPEILQPLCLPDGRILRCEDNALPDTDCLTEDPTLSGRAFKVVNRKEGAVYIAAFDLHHEGAAVEGCVHAPEPGIGGGKWLLYEHFTGEARRMDAGERHDFILDGPEDIRLFKLIRIEEGMAVIGLEEKFISTAAVRKTGEEIEILCDGTLLLYSERTVRVTGGEGREYPVCRRGELYQIKCPKGVVRIEQEP